MQRLLLCLLLFMLIQPCVGQQSKTGLAIYGEAGIPVGDFEDLYRMGYGGKLKLIMEQENGNAVTLMSGVNLYTIKLRYTTDDETQTYSVVPLLLGYRHFFHRSFFFEPAAGAGIYQMRHEYKDEKTIQWHTAFTAVIQLGYYKDKYEMSVRYQTGLKKNDNISMVVFSAGYCFSLGRKRSS